MSDYALRFQRNLGVLSISEQERLRDTNVLIIGDGGTGETIAIILARCGMERFTIAGEGVYAASDMNRQACCFLDTIGEQKVSVIKDTILKINPNARVSTCTHLPRGEELDTLIKECAIVIPAVDDLSYSILCFRSARKQTRPAVLCIPSGSLGWVCAFTHTTPTIEDVFGIPSLDYEGLRRIMHSREYRCAQYNFITSGDWRVSWFWEYFSGKRDLALLCPVSWIASSLAAMEVLKIATGKWRPTYAPKCWYIRKGTVAQSHFSLFIKYHRKLGWAIFGNGIGRHLHRLALWFWRRFFLYLKYSQDKALPDMGSSILPTPLDLKGDQPDV